MPAGVRQRRGSKQPYLFGTRLLVDHSLRNQCHLSSTLDYIFTYTFSSANVKDIDPNTLVIISHAFWSGQNLHSTLTAIYTQLVTAINEPTTGVDRQGERGLRRTSANWQTKIC